MHEEKGKKQDTLGKKVERPSLVGFWLGRFWVGVICLAVGGVAEAEETRSPASWLVDQARPIVKSEGVKSRPMTCKLPKEEEKKEEDTEGIQRIGLFEMGGGWSKERQTRERIEQRRGAEIGDLLEELGGLLWRRASPVAEAPSLRGGSGARLAIRLGDIPLLGALDTAGSLLHVKTLDPALFGSLGLIRGPASVIYGDRALTGVLSLSLPEPLWFASDPPKTWGGLVSTHYRGMDQSLGGSGRLEWKTPRFSLQLGASGRWDGDHRPAGASALEGSGYARAAASLRLDGRIGDRWEARVSYLFGLIAEAERIELRRPADDLERYSAQRHFASFELRNRLPLWKTQIRGLFGFQWLEESSHKRRYLPGGIAPIGEVKGRIPQQQWSGLFAGRSSPWERLDVQYGLELLYTDVQTQSLSSQGSTQERPSFGLQASRQTSAAFFVFGRVALLRGSTSMDIEGGLRFQALLQQIAPQAPFSPREWNLWQETAFVGLRLGLQEYGQIRMFYTEGFRVPDLLALAGLGLLPDRFQIPTDSQATERTQSLEASLELSFWSPLSVSVRLYLQALHGWLSPESTLYQGQRNYLGRPVTHLRPTATMNLLGIELSLRLRLWALLFLHADLAWQDSLQPPTSLPLPFWPAAPAFQAQLRLRYQPGPWGGIEIALQGWTDARATSAFHGLTEIASSQHLSAPAGLLLALRGDLRFSFFRLVLALENLLDTPAAPLGSLLPSPSRHLRLSLDASW